MFTLIGVPIDSAGSQGGTELAPAAFRSLGIRDAFESVDSGDLDVRIRAANRDPVTGVVGLDDVCETTVAIRTAVASALSAGTVPFLIGGCCTMVPGAVAGVRDVRGRAGLAHLDGHLDLYDQTSSPLGEAADMPVAVALGLGPEPWIDAAGGPSLTPSDTWIVGYRDREQSLDDGMVMPEDFDPPVRCLTTNGMRSIGLVATGEDVAISLAGTTEGFWVHLDLDIVDPELFFANDAPVPDGIDWEELTTLLEPLCNSPSLAGFSLGCYNPEKDRDQANGRRIVKMIQEVFGPH
ncbi:MAG: arginase family protein [Acidimicrobiia bacterium]